MNGDAISGASLASDLETDPGTPPKSRFALFTDSWISLQSSTAVALKLPISQGDFEKKYGSFGSSKVITQSIDAMRDVQATAKEFGDPTSLRSQLIKNPNMLAVDTPPDEIYTHTVWLGQRVSNNATTLISGMTAVKSAFNSMPPASKVENIKKYLFSQSMGPIPIAQKMSEEVQDLIKKLLKFEEKMAAYADVLNHYTNNSGALTKEVEDKLGDISKKITRLKDARDEAYDSWLKFTIAAASTAFACVAIGALLAPATGGVSLKVGVAAGAVAGGIMGAKAAGFRAEYSAYCNQLTTAEGDQRQKMRLQSDLIGFNTEMKRVGPAMAGFMSSLQQVGGVWTKMNNDLQYMVNNVTEKNIDELPFLVEGEVNKAIESWRKVDAAASQFTVSSLTNFKHIEMGDELPDAA